MELWKPLDEREGAIGILYVIACTQLPIDIFPLHTHLESLSCVGSELLGV